MSLHTEIHFERDICDHLGSHGWRYAEAMPLDRLRKQLDERGTLEVLRFGIDMVVLNATLKLAQFKPALSMNPDLQARYAANRLRVVRQGLGD